MTNPINDSINDSKDHLYLLPSETEMNEISDLLSPFGFIVNRENPPSIKIAKLIYQYSESIVATIGIEPEMIGFGGKISYSNQNGARLDEKSNAISIEVNDELNLASFCVLWTSIAVRFGSVEGIDEAITSLSTFSVTSDDYMKLLAHKWQSIEGVLSQTLSMIETEAQAYSNLSPKKINELTHAFMKLKGIEESVIPTTTFECTTVISQLSQSVNSMTGYVISEEVMQALHSLMAIRADVISKIKNHAQLIKEDSGEHQFKLPYQYFERINELAKTNNEFYLVDMAPAMAIATHIKQKFGFELENHHSDLFPTTKELMQMEEGINHFRQILTSHIKAKKTTKIGI